MTPAARQGLVDHARSRATKRPRAVECLEGRVLLSNGLGGPESSDDRGFVEAQANSLSRQKSVYLKVADLEADGLGHLVQGLPVQDGQVQATRIDKLLLIAGQYFQYASGKGYPLVPASGPALPRDVGVASGPLAVLLPTRELPSSEAPTPPAPEMGPVAIASPSSPAVAMPATPADLRVEATATPTPSAPATTSIASTAPSDPTPLPSPGTGGSAGFAVQEPMQPLSPPAAELLGTSTTPAAAPETSSSGALTLVPAPVSPPIGGLGTSTTPAAAPGIWPGALALNFPVGGDAATSVPEHGRERIEAPETAPLTSNFPMAALGTSVVAGVVPIPVPPTPGIVIGVRSILPGGRGLEPQGSISAGNIRLPDPSQRAEVGLPIASVQSDMIDGSSRPPRLASADGSTSPEIPPTLLDRDVMPGEVGGTVQPRTFELDGPSEDEEGEAEEDAVSNHGLIPLVIASATCAFLGNFASNAGMTGPRVARRRNFPTL